MSAGSDLVSLRDILRSAVRGLRETPTINKGLWNLVTTKPDTRNSIGRIVADNARKFPGRTALTFEGQRWSYQEFNAWANRIAGVLRAQGVQPGGRVAILMENRPEVLACVAATVKLGAIAGMLNHNQRGDVLAHSLKLTDADVLVAGEECREAFEGIRGLLDRMPSLLWDGARAPEGFVDLRRESATQAPADPPETAEVMARDAAFYIFTSGTTGMPKASRMTHYRWLRSMAGLSQLAVRFKADDVLYCPLPLYHNNALTVSWSTVLGAGAALALGRKFSASKFWDEIRAADATGFCYIGELCRYLLNRPPSPRDRDHRVRLMIGNGLRPEIWEAFQQRFGIEQVNEFYGASESNLAFVNGFNLQRTAGFCPLTFAIVEFDPETEQPVRDAQGYMRKVPKGGVGLLITEVSEKNPFDGYTDKQASEAKLFRDVFARGDVWFNSGDLVRDQGFKHIQFVDRVGDTFRWKGENVATTEVERALNAHPNVEQAVVYGVQVPGTDGRAGMAALSWKEGAFDGLGLAQLVCRELPAYAVPLFVRLRAEQEVTGTFKYRKVELKQQGFECAGTGEPVYVLVDRERGYEPLTAEIAAQIKASKIRL